MTPKRNDPCHCGSGKKYKHCHLKADREKERVEREERMQQATRPGTPLVSPTNTTPPSFAGPLPETDPEIQRLNELYEEFDAAPYAQKKEILRASIEEQALDGELAFEFFNDLYPVTIERGEREEFAALVSLLRAKQLQVYMEEIHWFWDWAITNALALEDDAALQHAANELFKHGGESIDAFFPALNCLRYHDRRDVLLKAMDNHGLQLVPERYIGNVKYEINQIFSNLLVLDYIETHAQNNLLDENGLDQLCRALTPYAGEVLRDDLESFVARAGGITSGEWTMDDFQFAPPPPQLEWFEEEEEETERDPAVAHLLDLSFEFLYYAHQTENIPLTKADLAREELVKYILKRHRGELVDVEPLGRSGRKKRKKIETNILLPDHRTLDRYMLRFLEVLSTRAHASAALFELVPAWTRFLQSKALISQGEGHDALRSMQALSQSMAKLVEAQIEDPLLTENVNKWRANAGV